MIYPHTEQILTIPHRVQIWSIVKFSYLFWTIGFRYEALLNFRTYFGQCPNDNLLYIPLHVCPNYPHTGLTTATAPSGHQMSTVVSWTVYLEHCLLLSYWQVYIFQDFCLKMKNDEIFISVVTYFLATVCVFVLLDFCLFSIIYAGICMFCGLNILLWGWAVSSSSSAAASVC